MKFCYAPRTNIPYLKFVFALQCTCRQHRILEQQSNVGHGVHIRPIVPLPHNTEASISNVERAVG
jgi:hypothetical protein